MPQCGATFNENVSPLDKGGLQGGFGCGNETHPGARDRRRYAPPVPRRRFPGEGLWPCIASLSSGDVCQHLAFLAHLSFQFVDYAFEFHSKGPVEFETPLEIFLRTEFVSQKHAGPATVCVSQGFCWDRARWLDHSLADRL